MTQSIQEVMTPNPVTCAASTTLVDAARHMRDADIGDVLVEKDGEVCGIVTDRDLVVRALAEDRDPRSTALADICSRDVTVLKPTDTVEHAIELMRGKALRRMPVCDHGRAVGIVSIGDLAVERDPRSALADISSAPPNT